MRKLALILGLCAAPVMAPAAPWEVWSVGETQFAGYCSDDADETCMTLHCTVGGGIDLAIVGFGAWSVTMGTRDQVLLSIAGGDPIIIDATIREAAGFGPEFFALGGLIDQTTLSALAQEQGFALNSNTTGLFVPLVVENMGASIQSALAACDG